MIPVLIDDQLHELVAKLAHCQDSKSGAQIFTGVIRVVINTDDPDKVYATLEVEETIFETESGEPINTRHIRV